MGLALTAPELQATAWALPGAVAPVHPRAAAQATLDGDILVHSSERRNGPGRGRHTSNGRPCEGARVVFLEKPGQQKDDDDKRNETATDIHSGLLYPIDAYTTV